MRYKTLGRSGLRVSEMALGAMTFGNNWGIGTDISQSKRMADYYFEQGGNFIDTANIYGNGESEEIVGELVRHNRHQWVVASKYSSAMQMGNVNGAGNHRKHMVQSLEASLKRLKMDYLDLFYVHCWDGITPAEEVMRALDDLVRAGKILHIGVSDTPAWIVAKSNMMAELRGWSQFIALQIPYNLIERSVERELLPMAKDMGLSVVTWGPLNEGLLTGKYHKGQIQSDRQGIVKNARIDAIVHELIKCSEELGVEPSQLAIRWIIDQSKAIIPIIGARKIEQLEVNMAALDLVIPTEVAKRLDEVSAIPFDFPFDFLDSDKHRVRFHAGMLDKLDIRRNTAFEYRK